MKRVLNYHTEYNYTKVMLACILIHGTVSYIANPMSYAKISLSNQSIQKSECRLDNGLVLKLLAIAYKSMHSTCKVQLDLLKQLVLKNK